MFLQQSMCWEIKRVKKIYEKPINEFITPEDEYEEIKKYAKEGMPIETL